MSSSGVHDPLTRAAALNKNRKAPKGSAFDPYEPFVKYTAFDYGVIAKHSKLVVDTRNAMKKHAAEMGERLVRA